MTENETVEPAADVSPSVRAQGDDELELQVLDLKPALEAVLMVTDEALDHITLAQAVGHPPADVADALEALADEYTEQGRGFELRNVAGGWRFFSREPYAPAVERFVLEGQHARLTQAALETMAVVAYRQPISRSRISAIRGVNVDGVVRTLVTRGLIIDDGADPESGAVLYRTTPYFLERMGLDTLSELPDLAPLLPELDEMDEPASDLERELTGQEPHDQLPDDHADDSVPAPPGDEDTASTGVEDTAPTGDEDAAPTVNEDTDA